MEKENMPKTSKKFWCADMVRGLGLDIGLNSRNFVVLRLGN